VLLKTFLGLFSKTPHTRAHGHELPPSNPAL
jgi:hypothetical protein